MALHCDAAWARAARLNVRSSAFIAGFVCPGDAPAINRNNSASDQKTCKAASFQPCSAGTSLDSFQFGGPLTLQFGIA
jgi:hypothetical protein